MHFASHMLKRAMFKVFLFAAASFSAMTLGLCQSQSAAPSESKALSSSTAATAWPSLAARIDCLPESGALVAAHRGTSRGEGLAENAIGSLEALIKGGVRLAEVDVGRLKSGEHILFHDGVWEEKSTGQGTVASSSWSDVQGYILKDETGRAAAERVARLPEYLAAAKGRVHLEIDFKSSAKYETVIGAIREAGMEHDVILIAYSKGQAAKLSRLAPEMALSVPVKKIGDIKAYRVSGVSQDNIYAWIGRRDGPLAAQLAERGIAVLTSRGDNSARRAAAVVVSDYALRETLTEGAAGLSRAERERYLQCLNEG